MRAIWLAALMTLLVAAPARAWGPEGHSIVAEIAQQRLTPEAAAAVAQLLHGRSLASVASWADDVRDKRKETAQWHFVDIPIASTQYDPDTQCKATSGGDCVVKELDRLKTDLHCAASDTARLEALKFTVHFVGDIHQPLHTVADAAGGNTIPVLVYLNGLACTQACKTPLASNFHAVWDSDLIHATVFDWGAYVDRLEADTGWLKGQEAQTQGIDGGTPAEWAVETHGRAITVWNLQPAYHIIDDDYFNKVLPTMDRQLGVAGLRLARFLNEAYAAKTCPAR